MRPSGNGQNNMDLFSLFATEPFIVITSYEVMKETFVKDGETYLDKKLNGDGAGSFYGVLDTNGDMWREHRRFTLTQLRDLGLGKDLMQQKILLEIEELHNFLDTHIGQSIDLPKVLDRSVGNIINLTLFNKRFSTTERDEFEYLKTLVDEMFNTVSEFRYFVQHLIPWTSKVIPGPTLHEKSREWRMLLDDFFKEQVEKHQKEIDFDDVESLDYVESYLKEQKRREADGDKETFCNQQLMAMCFDLFMAGLMTTTTTLTWGIAYYLHNPDVRQKIKKELDQVIGSSRLISTADKNNLPYLSAFLNETQRCANILPLNLLHIARKDTRIGGMEVKKGTGVIAQISTLMLDEKVFPNPFEFTPERFLENGKLKKVEELLPFSIGKRQCLGEGLARMELFSFFANLFNRYEIETGEGGLPSMDKSNDNFVMPRKFNVILKKRE
uniref:Cytochrome P450 n=1 Tax=Caenorhabditis tropicalis TaxID=1561998 RepID=A0A1I7SXT2_9PELO